VDPAFAKEMSGTADIDWSQQSSSNKALFLIAIPPHSIAQVSFIVRHIRNGDEF